MGLNPRRSAQEVSRRAISSPRFSLQSPGWSASVEKQILTYLPGESTVLPMRAAIFNALLGYSTNGTLPAPPYSCSTGNCTWDPFINLGVCSKCSNITNLLRPTVVNSSTSNITITGGGAVEVGTDELVWTLPSEYYNLSIMTMTDDNAADYPVMNVTELYVDDIYGMYSPERPFLHFALVNSSVHNATEATALECRLRVCLQKIEAGVSKWPLWRE